MFFTVTLWLVSVAFLLLVLLKTWGVSLRSLPFRRVQPPVAWEFDSSICESWGSVYPQYEPVKEHPQKWICTRNYVCDSNATKSECQLLQAAGWAVCIVQIVRGWSREPWVSKVMFYTPRPLSIKSVTPVRFIALKCSLNFDK